MTPQGAYQRMLERLGRVRRNVDNRLDALTQQTLANRNRIATLEAKTPPPE